ncbi:MAG TPA: hypothetical protein VJT31_04250 [Rugosimonospora sp.]|nr:hypothetical protein [Rugosimonospora sp.]
MPFNGIPMTPNEHPQGIYPSSREDSPMPKTITAILTGYFNSGDGKRSNTEWIAELRALSADEKQALAAGVCDITGDSIAAK